MIILKINKNKNPIKKSKTVKFSYYLWKFKANQGSCK